MQRFFCDTGELRRYFKHPVAEIYYFCRSGGQVVGRRAKLNPNLEMAMVVAGTELCNFHLAFLVDKNNLLEVIFLILLIIF